MPGSSPLLFSVSPDVWRAVQEAGDVFDAIQDNLRRPPAHLHDQTAEECAEILADLRASFMKMVS